MKKLLFLWMLFGIFGWTQINAQNEEFTVVNSNSSLFVPEEVQPLQTNQVNLPLFNNLIPYRLPATTLNNEEIMITNALSQQIDIGDEIACASSSYFVDNNLYQIFYLEEDFGIEDDFYITEVQYANGQVITPTGFPIDINLYQIDEEEDLLTDWEDMELLASTSYWTTNDDSYAFTSVPITATVDAGKLLVMELVLVDDGTFTHYTRLGVNSLNHIRTSYMLSGGCGYNVPTPFSEVYSQSDGGGFLLTDRGYIWNIIGGEPDDFTCESPDVTVTIENEDGDAFDSDLDDAYYIRIAIDGGFGNPTYSVYIDDELKTASGFSSLDYVYGPYTDLYATHQIDVKGNVHVSCSASTCVTILGDCDAAECLPDTYFISNVSVVTAGNSMDHSSGFDSDTPDSSLLPAVSTPGYADNSSIVYDFDLNQGTEITITINPDGNHTDANYNYRIFIDRNLNNEFENTTHEKFYDGPASETDGSLIFNFDLANLPEYNDVVLEHPCDSYLVRIEMYGADGDCEFGETEDYTLSIISVCPPEHGQCAQEGEVYINHVWAQAPNAGTTFHNDSSYSQDPSPYPPLEAPTTEGYGDYRSMVFELDLNQDTTFDYEVTTSGPDGAIYDFEVWMDRNQDNTFADGSETEFLFYEYGNTTGAISGNYVLAPDMINVPCGESREFVMRIIMTAKYFLGYDDEGNEIWCNYSETEDYTFRKSNSCVPPPGGQCAPDGEVYINHVWAQAPNTGYVLHNDSGYTVDPDPAPLQSPSTAGYGDYRDMVFELDLDKDTTFDFEVTAYGPTGTIYDFEVWMDRNRDNIFADGPEQEFLFSDIGNTTGELIGNFPLTPQMINVPCGEEREFVMRIIMNAKYFFGYNDEGEEVWCQWSESEDYTFRKINECELCPAEEEVFIGHVWAQAPNTGYVLHNDSGYTVDPDPAPLQSPSTAGYGDYRDMVFEMDLSLDTTFDFEVIANGPAGTVYDFEVWMDRNQDNIFADGPEQEFLFSDLGNTTGELIGNFPLTPQMINVPCGEAREFVMRIIMTAKYLLGYDDEGNEIWCEYGETEDYTFRKSNSCPPTGGQCAGDTFYINKVTGTDGNTPAENTSGYDSGYGDYTDIIVVVDLSNAVDGNPYFEFTIESDGNYPDVDYYYEAWVDRNQDGVFSNDELMELVWFETITGGSTSSPVRLYLGDFPEYNGEGCLHPTRDYTMRIIQVVDCVNPDETQTFTEIEDYTIRITGECPGEMSVEDVIFENFNYYPNPTTSVLTLKATNTIEEIALYNLLGQKVKQIKPDSSEIQLNLEELSTGLYLMEVKLDGIRRTFRVVKK